MNLYKFLLGCFKKKWLKAPEPENSDKMSNYSVRTFFFGQEHSKIAEFRNGIYHNTLIVYMHVWDSIHIYKCVFCMRFPSGYLGIFLSFGYCYFGAMGCQQKRRRFTKLIDLCG